MSLYELLQSILSQERRSSLCFLALSEIDSLHSLESFKILKKANLKLLLLFTQEELLRCCEKQNTRRHDLTRFVEKLSISAGKIKIRVESWKKTITDNKVLPLCRQMEGHFLLVVVRSLVIPSSFYFLDVTSFRSIDEKSFKLVTQIRKQFSLETIEFVSLQAVNMFSSSIRFPLPAGKSCASGKTRHGNASTAQKWKLDEYLCSRKS